MEKPISPQKANQMRIAQRQVARKLALIAIYQWQMTDNSLQDILLGIQDDRDLSSDYRKCDAAYLLQLVKKVIADHKAIDAVIEPMLDRGADRLDQIERAALRLGTVELQHHIEVPYRVVVNEAVNLSRKFGAEQSHKYINGVLDKLAQRLRKAETRGASS